MEEHREYKRKSHALLREFTTSLLQHVRNDGGASDETLRGHFESWEENQRKMGEYEMELLQVYLKDHEHPRAQARSMYENHQEEKRLLWKTYNRTKRLQDMESWLKFDKEKPQDEEDEENKPNANTPKPSEIVEINSEQFKRAFLDSTYTKYVRSR